MRFAISKGESYDDIERGYASCIPNPYQIGQLTSQNALGSGKS